MLQVDDRHLQLTLKKLQHWEPKKALGRCGGVIEREAKERCPVKTGDLRRSITFEVDKNECEVYTNKEYAPWNNVRWVNRAKSVNPKQLRIILIEEIELWNEIIKADLHKIEKI